MSKVIRDVFDPNLRFSVTEAEEEQVGGKAVLAKISGEFFVPEGISRNNRYYPRELWEKVVNDPSVQTRLQERRMYGTIGHDQMLNDQAVLEGKISHFVTKLGMQDGKGVGEALILDTPAGQILNTLARAGSKLFVSSRANGTFKGEMKGVPRVDPDTYTLDTFDFVLDPGFVQANPSLVESINKILETQPKAGPDNDPQGQEGDIMSAQLLESLAKENGNLKNTLEEATKKAESLETKSNGLETEVKSLREKLEKADAIRRMVEKFKRLGDSPEEIEKAFDVAEKTLDKYRALGTVEELDKALSEAQSFVDSMKALGTPADIAKAMEMSVKTVKSYENLGTPADIVRCFDMFEGWKKKAAAESAEKRIKELSTELRVSEDKIRKLFGKVSEKEIKELFKDVAESVKIQAKFRSTSTPAAEPKAGDDKGVMSKSRGARLMESFSR